MTATIFSVEDLNRMLPLVKAIVADIREKHVRLRRELASFGVQPELPWPETREILRDLPWETRDRIDDFRDLLQELTELGLYLRDLEKGLVEAYGERNGEIVFYSWRPGEERVSYWHELSGPPTDRRPLPAVTT